MTQLRVENERGSHKAGRGGIPDPTADQSIPFEDRRQHLLAMLADPMTESLSTRELARVCRTSYHQADRERRLWNRNRKAPTG